MACVYWGQRPRSERWRIEARGGLCLILHQILYRVIYLSACAYYHNMFPLWLKGKNSACCASNISKIFIWYCYTFNLSLSNFISLPNFQKRGRRNYLLNFKKWRRRRRKKTKWTSALASPRALKMCTAILTLRFSQQLKVFALVHNSQRFENNLIIQGIRIMPEN